MFLGSGMSCEVSCILFTATEITRYEFINFGDILLDVVNIYFFLLKRMFVQVLGYPSSIDFISND